MKPVLLFYLMITGFSSYCQTNSLQGKIADAKTRKPLSFVTIALIDSHKIKTKHTFTDSAGNYSMAGIVSGRYTLLYSFIGYDSLQSAFIVVTDTSHIICETVYLQRAINALEAVTVLGRKPVIETKVDGLVYNATSEAQLPGGSALDVLRKVPLLFLNQNGDIGVAGNSAVKIFIDDKPAALYGSTPADYLSQLSTDRIDRVRVITNPSARYEADGAAVVLIYIKKNRFKNLTGTTRLNGSLGDYRNSLLYNVTLFYKTGRFAFSLGHGYNVSNHYLENAVERQATDQSTFVKQQGFDTVSRKNPSFNFGVDVDIDSLNSLNLNATLIAYNYTDYMGQYSHIKNGNAAREYFRYVYQDNKFRYPTVSLAYNKRFKKEGRDLSFLGYYTSRNTNHGYSLLQIEEYTNGYHESYTNETDNKELSLQTDFTTPAGKKNRWETGIKYSLREAESNYQVLPYDVIRSGFFTYTQQVMAAYVSYETAIGKWQLRTGVRYEQTNINAIFNGSKVVIDPYKNGVPNILLSRSYKNNHVLSFSYTQSVFRPVISYLNPAINFSDSLNINKGNPALDPQITHRLETAYMIRLPSNSFLRLSMYGTRVTNSILQIRRLLPEGVSQTTWENIGHDRRVGFSASWNQALSQKMKLIVTFNTNWQEQKVPELLLYNNGTWLYASAYLSYTFKNGLVLDGYIMSQSRSFGLQGESWTIFPQYYILSAYKNFWKNKMGIAINLESIFTPQQAFNTHYRDVSFVQRSISYNSNRLVQLRFSYRFNQNVSETKTRAGRKAQAVPTE